MSDDTGSFPVAACPVCEDIPRVNYSSRNEHRPPAHCGACKREIPVRVVLEPHRLPESTMPPTESLMGGVP